MKVAVLGGSFNPVHIGHLVLAQEVCIRLGYDKVLFVPANLPPHKELDGGASAWDRFEMVKLAVADNPFFEADDCELVRGGISYSYDTVAHVEHKYAEKNGSSALDGKVGLIMGDDLVAGFDSWSRAAELAERADLILARRIVCPQSEAPVFSYPHTELENAVLPISSSDIRNGIRSDAACGGTDVAASTVPPVRKLSCAWRYLVTDAVYRYIIRRNLYGYRDI